MRASPSLVGTSVLVLLCLATAATLLVTRLALGPADLYEKDQPKTLAYTADVLIHDRWALPRDVIYQPATKPPLYNWAAAVVMKVTGSWSETAMKSPSLIGAAGIGAILVYLGAGASSPRSGAVANADDGPGTVRLSSQPSSRHGAIALGALACAIWFAFGMEPRHGSVLRLMYLARPDMLQAFFLTGAWAAATLAMVKDRDEGKARDEGGGMRDEGDLSLHPSSLRPHPYLHPFLFWLCVTGAILTKGPLAALAILYPIFAARLIAGRWSAVWRLRPIVGVAGMLAVAGTWLFFAYRTDPDHVRGVMLGAELVHRITDKTPEGLEKPLWYSAMWFFTKGGPFALVAAAAIPIALFHKRLRMPADGVAIGAAIWVVVLVVGLSLPAGKRIDYLVPSFAPAAYLAAWLLLEACRRTRVPVAVAGLLPLGAALVLSRAHLTKFFESKTPTSGHIVAFAKQVRERVGDDERLLVIVRGKHPLQALLRRHQGSALDIDDLKAARWVVLPAFETDAYSRVRSGPVPFGFKTMETRDIGVICLFDMTSDDRPTLDELVRSQRELARWNPEENPYRSPNTAWIETAESKGMGR